MKPANPNAPGVRRPGRSGSARKWGRVWGSLLLCLLAAGPARAASDISAAEQALFVDKHLAGLQAPATLHYRFHKTGTLEAAFDDSVDLSLKAQANGSCCDAQVAFFSGARAMHPPDIALAQGNPVILYFLERDIREMERLTQGKANYFRKRIRMAVFDGAAIKELTLLYRGQPVAVREISIAPYLDDPNRPRYEKLATKQYQFLLAPAVPGGLYGIRTRIPGAAADGPPLLGEELLIEGAQAASSQHQP
jgi:hypothetical protein